MSKIPVRFKRVAAVFDEVAKARLCDESSGSEHSGAGGSLTDLSDLVNSFLEREFKEERESDQEKANNAEEKIDESERNSSSSDYYCETRDVLKGLFASQDDDQVKSSIHGAVEKAVFEFGNCSSVDFKRRLMARLRSRGFDAGLCKSWWEKTGHCPSGFYEYIDVLVHGTRYVVEVSLAKEFDIARPTGSYTALLDIFPRIFVGKQDEIKQITRLMSKAVKKSMKCREMHVPPWRKLAYMQSKWFSSYKRTTNDAATQKTSNPDEELRRKRLVGFTPLSAVSYFCREGFAAKGDLKVGYLAAALNDSAVLS